MGRVSIFIKNNIRLLIGAFVVIFIALIITSLILGQRSTKVLVNGETFTVTLAKTEKERQIGLSKTDKIGENQGMLFIFEKADYYPFWMKEMKFPIDIIYINADKVTTVIDNAKPITNADGNLEVYEPAEKSDKVLELKAGTAKKHSIKKGTSVKIENL
ncbi:MAG: DUF192 domain-containing protein [Candidatus Levybacteria bacterium]|nr:DUF192 domain-containing protein [Candidatus Levybacteria bacterium]